MRSKLISILNQNYLQMMEFMTMIMNGKKQSYHEQADQTQQIPRIISRKRDYPHRTVEFQSGNTKHCIVRAIQFKSYGQSRLQNGRVIKFDLYSIAKIILFVQTFNIYHYCFIFLRRCFQACYVATFFDRFIITQMRTANLIAALILVEVVLACRGSPNPNPIIDARFSKVQIHQFGEKYHYFDTLSNQNFYLLRVWGNSYQAGVAYGTLMKSQLKANIKNVWEYMEENIETIFKIVKKIPKGFQPLAKGTALKILRSILLVNHYFVRPFTPKRYLDQYAGISAGSGIPASHVIELNMIPELLKAGCSILGVWGKATQKGDLIHLRALDWDIKNPMHKYPTLVIYNLNEKGSHPFMNVAWAGFIGSLTGFGQYSGIGEQVRKQKPANKNQTRFGKPWTYALRDVLQFSQAIDHALDSLNKTHRTCSIHVGISNIKNNTFRLIKYSQKQFIVFDDKNFPFTATHSQMDGVVSMPTHDDKGDSCFNDLLKVQYGNIDIDWIVQVLAASHHTGDTQMAAYNFVDKQLLLQVSNETLRAYERPTIRVQLEEFFTFQANQS